MEGSHQWGSLTGSQFLMEEDEYYQYLEDLEKANVSVPDLYYNMSAAHAHNQTLNFFDAYYAVPRFVVETVFAVAALTANVVTVVLLMKGSVKQKGTAYRILFYNLSTTNALCCLFSWTANNSLLIFERPFVHISQEEEGMCRVFLCMMAAMFVSVAFGTESCITMLGFTAVQYRSVSKPLVQWAMARQRMAYWFLVVSWILTFLFGCVPFGILLSMTNNTECNAELHMRGLSIVIAGATTAVTIEGISYIIIIVLSILIYVKLRRYAKGFWNMRFDGQIQAQRRTFGTTLLLFMTLVVCSLPYMILYVVTLNARSLGHIQQSAVIHYMNLLPYLKFFTDPIIYGMRMREVKESWFRFMSKIGLAKCACARNELSVPRSPPPYLMHHVTFV